jgi:hypothetical protein
MRSLKRLQHKDWQTVRDLWLGHLPPIDFESQYPEPTLGQLPDLRHPELNASGLAEFPYLPGVREAVFREAVLMSRKFIYCASLLPILCKEGKNTWTAVSAYEAAFYGAKAFCFLLGFAPVDRNSKIYVDAFYETEHKVGKRRVKSYDTLRVHGLEARLTHDVLWSLVTRLLDTTTFDRDPREIQTQLKIVDWDKFSSFRNAIFYDGSFWPRSESMSECDIIAPVQNVQISAAVLLGNTSAVVPFAEEYFFVARLFRRLLASMFWSIAELAPAVRTEVEAFDAIGQ